MRFVAEIHRCCNNMSGSNEPPHPQNKKQNLLNLHRHSLTQDAQAVVDGDDDDIAVAGQDAAVDHVARALHVGPAVDVHHHRLLAVLIMDVCKKEPCKGRKKEKKKKSHSLTETELKDAE